MKSILIILGILCLAFTGQLSAHGDLSEQIERISKRLEKDPDNAKLYLRRGQLHAQHKDFDASKKDYVQARKLDSSLTVTDLLLAQLFSKFDRPDSALIFANSYLQHEPGHPKALITRAGIYQQLRQPDRCQKDLESAIANLKDPNPSHYISITEAVLLADTSNVSEALGWLRKGEERYGFDIVLKSKEVDLYMMNGDYEHAVSAIDQIIERFPRKEKWLFQKALVFEKAGNADSAKTHYEATLTAIEKLPKRIQRTSKMVGLKLQTLEKLQILLKQQTLFRSILICEPEELLL